MTGTQKESVQREKEAPENTPSAKPKRTGGSVRRNSGAWRPIVDVTDVFAGDRGIGRSGLYDMYDGPIGVHLRVEEAVKAGPLLEAETEWETGG